MLADVGGVVYHFFCLINMLCVFEDRVVIASSFFWEKFLEKLAVPSFLCQGIVS